MKNLNLHFVCFDDGLYSDTYLRYDTMVCKELLRQSKQYDINLELKLLVPNTPGVHFDIPTLPDGTVLKRLEYFHDCMIIHNPETNGMMFVDFQDGPNWSFAAAEHSPNFKGALVCMYWPDHLQQRFGHTGRNHLFLPGCYFDMEPSYTEQHVEEIKEIRQSCVLDNRLLFAGTIGDTDDNYGYQISMPDDSRMPTRRVARILQEKYPDEVLVLDRTQKLNRADFWRLAAKHRINLALPGHPWCNREHELWHLGLPVLAQRWDHHVSTRPIPNHHYIAVSDIGSTNHMGVALDPERAADRIIQTHRYAIQHPEWCERIGRNGQMRYYAANTPAAAVGTWLNLLDLDNL